MSTAFVLHHAPASTLVTCPVSVRVMLRADSFLCISLSYDTIVIIDIKLGNVKGICGGSRKIIHSLYGAF